MTKLILTHDSSYDTVSRKEVPKLQNSKFNILTYFYTKIMKNYNGAYEENYTML